MCRLISDKLPKFILVTSIIFKFNYFLFHLFLHQILQVKLFLSLFIIFFLVCLCSSAQVKDSSFKIKINTISNAILNTNPYTAVLDSNIFLNFKGKPQALAVTLRMNGSAEYFFYIFAALFLLLGLLRTIFSRFFTTMFRVFFNTSLRQNQLTDQLEQAALPSLLFNIFFVLSMGLYIYILYEHYNIHHDYINWVYLGLCMLTVAVCYTVKYVSLLFTGWLTNHKPEAKIYIFSIFLLNKINGMLLLPFTILIAFSTYKLADYASIISLFILAILLLSRFFRTYGLLQNRLKLNGMHFLIYIISLEILPILLIYKTAVIFFSINS